MTRGTSADIAGKTSLLPAVTVAGGGIPEAALASAGLVLPAAGAGIKSGGYQSAEYLCRHASADAVQVDEEEEARPAEAPGEKTAASPETASFMANGYVLLSAWPAAVGLEIEADHSNRATDAMSEQAGASSPVTAASFAGANFAEACTEQIQAGAEPAPSSQPKESEVKDQPAEQVVGAAAKMPEKSGVQTAKSEDEAPGLSKGQRDASQAISSSSGQLADKESVATPLVGGREAGSTGLALSMAALDLNEVPQPGEATAARLVSAGTGGTGQNRPGTWDAKGEVDMNRNQQDPQASAGGDGREIFATAAPMPLMESAAPRRGGVPEGERATVSAAGSHSSSLLPSSWIAPASLDLENIAGPHVLEKTAGSATAQGRDLAGEITQRAVELKRLDLDSMTVVLRPDSHTELSLQLSRRDGVVEIKAQCERGDWGNLGAHWEELQKSLEAKGIRLGQLETANPGAGESSGGGAGAFERGRAGREKLSPAAEETFYHSRGSRAPASALQQPVVRPRAACARSWETWA